MTKSSQITLACEILTVLKIADPRSILAGGAVRDWRMLNAAGRDLDFYTSLPAYNGEAEIKEFITTSLRGTNIKLLGNKDLPENYSSMVGLKHVFEFERDGQLCNLMVMERGYLPQVAHNFDTSVCQASFDGDTYWYSDNFEVTLATGICFLHKDAKEDAKHVRKLADRFPTMRFVREVHVRPDPQADNFEDFQDDIPW
ncbi:hypothetical protein [Escherichia phage phiWec190]|nr:hypothetical protein [Escherichia phage phiWec188]BDU13750.1 hypothetical protein [Escherichia phage phiWec190]